MLKRRLRVATGQHVIPSRNVERHGCVNLIHFRYSCVTSWRCRGDENWVPPAVGVVRA